MHTKKTSEIALQKFLLSVSSTTIGKAAPSALAIVLLLLAGFSLWVAVATSDASDKVEISTFLSVQYEDAHYTVGAEESLERKYHLEPSPDVRAKHQAAADGLIAALNNVRQQGQPSDLALVEDVLSRHKQYLAATSRMFAAVDAGDTSRANSIDKVEVEPVYVKIEGQVETAAQQHREQALRSVADVDKIQNAVVTATPIVFAVGLCLLAFFWFVLRAYQHRIEEANQREAQVEIEGVKASVEAKEAQLQSIRDSEERLRIMVQNLADVIILVNLDGTIRYSSSAVEDVLGTQIDMTIGKAVTDLFHPDERVGVELFLAEIGKKPGQDITHEFRAQHVEGAKLYLDAIGTDLGNDENTGGILLTCRDITERKALEDQLAYQAYHDPLTGLANRTLFRERVGRAWLVPGDQQSRLQSCSWTWTISNW